MRFQFKEHVTLITGASSGIGAALAKTIVERDGRVALVARSKERLENLVSEIDPTGEKTSVHLCDVTDRQSAKTALQDVEKRWRRVDCAILNAGIGGPTSFREFDANHVREIYETNVFGVMHFVESALPLMQNNGGGVIVGVSSLAAHIPSAWVTAYASSKAALTHFLDGMRKKLKKQNIRVISVEPGFVKTPMTAENKNMFMAVEVEEAARIIADGIEKGKSVIRFPKLVAAFALFNRMLPVKIKFVP